GRRPLRPAPTRDRRGVARLARDHGGGVRRDADRPLPRHRSPDRRAGPVPRALGRRPPGGHLRDLQPKAQRSRCGRPGRGRHLGDRRADAPPPRGAERDDAPSAHRAARAGAGAGGRAVGLRGPDLRPVRLRAGDHPRRADRAHAPPAAAARRRPRHRPGRHRGRGGLPPGRGGRARGGPAVRARQPRPRRALVGPAAARRPIGAQRRDGAPVPPAHRDRRHGDRLRRLPADLAVDRHRPARRHARRGGGARHHHPGPRRAVERAALDRPGQLGPAEAGLARRPDPPPGHRHPGAHRPGPRRPVGPAGRRRPGALRPALPGPHRPRPRRPRPVLRVERRSLARLGPPLRRLLRPHRPRPRHRAGHRGAVGGLPRRHLAGHAAGRRAGHRDQPRRGDERVDGLRLAGHPVVSGRLL
ncbi:MAG: UPF0256 protein SAV5428, partial [uncultured Blastococcus sp.]